MSSPTEEIVYLTAYVILPKDAPEEAIQYIYKKLTDTFKKKLANDPERLAFYFNDEEKTHKAILEKLTTDHPKVRTKVYKVDFSKKAKNAYAIRNLRALKNSSCVVVFSDKHRNLSAEFTLQAAEESNRMYTIRTFNIPEVTTA